MSQKRSITVNGLRLCLACNEQKPVDAFGKRRTLPDGLVSICKECHNKKTREARNSSDDYVLYMREYRRKNPGRIRDINKRSHEKNKEKQKERRNERKELKRLRKTRPDLRPHLTDFGRHILAHIPPHSHPIGISERALIEQLHGLGNYSGYVEAIKTLERSGCIKQDRRNKKYKRVD
jgi:hypothetical protein